MPAKLPLLHCQRCGVQTRDKFLNPTFCKGSATSNNTKLVHWSLMSGLLQLEQQRGISGRAAVTFMSEVKSEYLNL